MQRILIIGIPGSGKTTLANQIAEKLQLPVHHLDRYFWKPGWVQSEIDEWRDAVANLVKLDRWIIDGNYATTLETRIARADVVIYLDFNRYAGLAGAMKRIILGFGRTRPDLADGCPEKVDLEFLKYIWDFPSSQRPIVEKVLAAFTGRVKVIRLQNRQAVQNFLQDLPQHPDFTDTLPAQKEL